MLENWLRPIQGHLTEDLHLDKERLGARIRRYEDHFPSLAHVQAVLVGIGGEEADAVRRALYRLSFPFGKMQIADLGNVRKEDHSFVAPLLQELLEGNICPIIIGRHDRLVQAQFHAHHAWQASVSLVVVDEKIAFHPRLSESKGYYLNPVLNGKQRLFHAGFVGCQSHFADDEALADLERRHIDCVRLGKAKAAIGDVEPYLREADLVSFHLSALKSAEAPAVMDASPSGFLSEEACQLSRYAGMSDKLRSIGFYGYEYRLDRHEQTAQTIAQLVWYFLDGFCNRKNDFPASMNDLVEYIVESKEYDVPLTFWKSNKSGRWWLQVPVKTKKKHQRHRLVPCSYNDYLQTSKGEIPDRLVMAFGRFE